MISKKAFKNVSLEESVANKPSFKTAILDGWMAAKDVLTLIKNAVKNPICKLVIECAIVLGDGLYNKFYKEQ